MVAADTPTVFVVDDDADIRASIQDLLGSAGLRSECFETAEQFLKRTPWNGPSCLILDVSLPGISGLDFQQQLRNRGRHLEKVSCCRRVDWRWIRSNHSDPGRWSLLVQV
jgi:FixJ family two-component response regulator